MFRTPQSPARRTAAVVAAPALAAALLSSCATAAAAPSQAREDQASSRSTVVQSQLDGLVERDGFTGALAATRTADGRVRDYTAGVGDLETGEEVPRDGQVRIASNTKTFTATVVLQLVDEGRVDLDAPIETYLPGVVRGEGIDGDQITVRQVLQHTSGLPEYAGAIYTDPTDPTQALHASFEPRELVALGLSQPATSAPGTAWAYSNTNYAVAGLLVEAVTGGTVGDEITRRIIEPLDLDGTYWPADGELQVRGEHPRGYAYPRSADGTVTGDPIDVTDQDTSAPWAAGALVSTPSDLLTFFTALVDGELLTPESLEQMQTTVPVPPEYTLRGVEGEAYGLGLQTFPTSCGVEAWTHGGDISGTHTRGAVTEDGRGVIVAVTSDPRSMESAVHLEEAVDAAVCDR